MASKKFKDVELVNAAGDKRTATSPAQYAQFTFDGFYLDNDEAVKEQLAAEKAEADAAAAAEEKAAADAEATKTPAVKPAVRAGASAPGEKTAGTNPA